MVCHSRRVVKCAPPTAGIGSEAELIQYGKLMLVGPSSEVLPSYSDVRVAALLNRFRDRDRDCQIYWPKTQPCEM